MNIFITINNIIDDENIFNTNNFIAKRLFSCSEILMSKFLMHFKLVQFCPNYLLHGVIKKRMFYSPFDTITLERFKTHLQIGCETHARDAQFMHSNSEVNNIMHYPHNKAKYQPSGSDLKVLKKFGPDRWGWPRSAHPLLALMAMYAYL